MAASSNTAKKPVAEDFEGKCYVFDNRIAVDVNTVNPKDRLYLP